MMRLFGTSRLVMPVLASAVLAMAGCSGTGEDEVSPTPVPGTPTPTPVPPFSDSFRVSSMVVGTSSQGVDLDGDGTIDNAIEDALVEATDSILEAVEAALIEAGLEQSTINQILRLVEQILAATLSVEGISNTLDAQIQNGETVYSLRFDQKASGSEDTTLFWGSGSVGFDGVTVAQILSEQVGKITSSKDGAFGPDDLTFTVVFDIPQSEDDPEFDLYMRGGRTTLKGYTSSAIADAFTGGALAVTDISVLVEAVLEAVQGGIDTLCDTVDCGETYPVIPVDDIILELETALAAQADLDLDSSVAGNDAFSIGLVVDAAAASNTVWP